MFPEWWEFTPSAGIYARAASVSAAVGAYQSLTEPAVDVPVGLLEGRDGYFPEVDILLVPMF